MQTLAFLSCLYGSELNEKITNDLIIKEQQANTSV